MLKEVTSRYMNYNNYSKLDSQSSFHKKLHSINPQGYKQRFPSKKSEALPGAKNNSKALNKFSKMHNGDPKSKSKCASGPSTCMKQRKQSEMRYSGSPNQDFDDDDISNLQIKEERVIDQ